MGARLPDPDGLLQGEGKRLIEVRTLADTKRPAVKRLLHDAWKDAQALPRKGST